MSSEPTLSPNPSWSTDVGDELACKYAGEFFATWMTNPEQLKAKTYRDDDTVTDGQLLEWFTDTQNKAISEGNTAYQQFIDVVIKPALDNCGASVCKSLGWTGNGDLAGIGVFASYYMEAALATIYLFVLLFYRFSSWESSPHKTFKDKNISERLLDAFLGTLGDLGQSAFLFSLIVMCASLNSIIVAHNDPLSVTTYEITTAILVTIFSMCPPTLLYNLGEHGRGPKVLYLLTLCLLWALMLVIVNLGRKTDPSKELFESGSIGNPFEVYCPVIGDGHLEAIRSAAVALSGLAILWLVFLALYKCLDWKDTKKRKFIRKQWRVGFSLLAWVAMWIFLGVFTVLRARSIKVAGASDQSNEWSFGQIVAVAAWAPVVVNFLYILFFGIEEGKSAKLPKGYEVRPSPGDGEED